jgi:predicted nucleic-acid-binding protein
MTTITLADAKVILRYLLRENSKMVDQAIALIAGHSVVARYEIIAEVVYVLQKVYALPKEEIAKVLRRFVSLPNISAEYPPIIAKALDVFATQKLDFVDCLLCAFHLVAGYEVFTFDKKLESYGK